MLKLSYAVYQSISSKETWYEMVNRQSFIWCSRGCRMFSMFWCLIVSKIVNEECCWSQSGFTAYCLDTAHEPRAQLLRSSAWLLHLDGDKAPFTTIVVRLHAPLLSLHRKWWSQLWFGIGRIFHAVRIHGCCPVRATGSSLPGSHYLPDPFTVYNEGGTAMSPASAHYTTESSTP